MAFSNTQRRALGTGSDEGTGPAPRSPSLVQEVTSGPIMTVKCGNGWPHLGTSLHKHASSTCSKSGEQGAGMHNQAAAVGPRQPQPPDAGSSASRLLHPGSGLLPIFQNERIDVARAAVDGLARSLTSAC